MLGTTITITREVKTATKRVAGTLQNNRLNFFVRIGALQSLFQGLEDVTSQCVVFLWSV